MIDQPLTREEIISVIEGRGAARRIPTTVHFWTSAQTFSDREQEAKDLLDKYPMDVLPIGIGLPGNFDAPEDDPEYRWVNYAAPANVGQKGLDAYCAIEDWGQLDGILENFPDPNYRGLLPYSPEDDGRYRVGCWWFCFFERHWSLRGMTNALMDYYTDPDSVHRLFRALTDFYKVAIVRAGKEVGCNGVFTSDDIGMQTGPFFSIEIFREFFKPYYKELIDTAHAQRHALLAAYLWQC